MWFCRCWLNFVIKWSVNRPYRKQNRRVDLSTKNTKKSCDIRRRKKTKGNNPKGKKDQPPQVIELVEVKVKF